MSATKSGLVAISLLTLAGVAMGTANELKAQITTNPYGTLVGTVETGLGRPVGGAIVEIRTHDNATAIARAVTSADGKFKITHLRTGRYIAEVTRSSEGRGAKEFAVTAPRTANVRIVVVTPEA